MGRRRGDDGGVHISGIDDFGANSGPLFEMMRPSRKSVASPATLDHIGQGLQSTSNDNHHGRKWKRPAAPRDQMAPGRLAAEHETPHRREMKSPTKAIKSDAPPSDFFGPCDISALKLEEVQKPSSTQGGAYDTSCNITQRSLAHIESEKERLKAMTGGVNGILIGAGQAELPWSTKRHVPQTPRSDYTRPGALVTDGHGTVQWAGLERKKQNLVHSSLDAHAVSPRRNVRRMVPQGMSKMNNILKDQSIAASSAPRPKPATFLTSPRAGLDLSPSSNLIADTPPASAKASESSWSMMNKMDASSIIALGSPTNASFRSASAASQASHTSHISSFSARAPSPQRPTTAEPRVPPHMRTSITSPWAPAASLSTGLQPENTPRNFAKRRVERPLTASSYEQRAQSRPLIIGALAAPWGVD